MFFKPEYILILIFTIVVDYYAGILIENETIKSRKRKYLILSLIANIGVLAIFKYYNFINDNITGLATVFGWHNPIPYFKWLLPIGLSFHTFQAMSYTIEVYRGNQKAERHFGIYSLYVMFYPQLVAGPIERPQNIVHQFHEKKEFSYDNMVEGLNLIAYGLFKKVVIGDRLAEYVDYVYNDVGNANSISILLTCYFFAIQIYCDFSGYSDIARGTAKAMGYDLMINFNRPFQSKSVSEFWRRWHISLSTWFNDYLFTPMVTSLRDWGKLSIVFGLLVTFGLSGLWHGAGSKFIVYGLVFGIALVYEFLTKKERKKFFKKIPTPLGNAISIMLTFNFVAFALTFFRARTIHQALEVFRKLFEFDFSINLVQLTAGRGPLNFLLSFFVISILFLSYLLPINLKFKNNIPFLVGTTLLIIILGKNAGAEFIYFQF